MFLLNPFNKGRHPHSGKSKDLKRFVILTYPRTGSHHLIFGLRNYPSVVTYGELFSTLNSAITLYPEYNISKSLIETRNKNPQKFLNYIFSDYENGIDAVGFKLNYYQSKLFSSQKIIDILSNEFGVHWIHLKRKNVIKNYISYQLLQETNICFAVSQQYESFFFDKTKGYVSEKNLEQYRPTIHISFDEMMHYIKDMEAEKEKHGQMIGNAPCLDLYYEDFRTDISDAIGKFSKFMFNDPEKLAIKTEINEPVLKLNQRPLNEVVSNFDEISQKLKDTEYFSMLGED